MANQKWDGGLLHILTFPRHAVETCQSGGFNVVEMNKECRVGKKPPWNLIINSHYIIENKRIGLTIHIMHVCF